MAHHHAITPRTIAQHLELVHQSLHQIAEAIIQNTTFLQRDLNFVCEHMVTAESTLIFYRASMGFLLADRQDVNDQHALVVKALEELTGHGCDQDPWDHT